MTHRAIKPETNPLPIPSAPEFITYFQKEQSQWGQPEKPKSVETPIGTAIAITEKGPDHENNEDAWGIKTDGVTVFTICDGVSTSPNGLEASHKAVEAIMTDNHGILMESAMSAHEAAEDGATTLLATEIIENELLVSWLGNSRVEIYRKNDVGNLEMVFTNILDTNKQKTERSDAIGDNKPHPNIHFAHFTLKPGDVIIMGSDGVIKDSAGIKQRIDLINEHSDNPENIAQGLMATAKADKKNIDDKTCIVSIFKGANKQEQSFDLEDILYWNKVIAQALEENSRIHQKNSDYCNTQNIPIEDLQALTSAHATEKAIIDKRKTCLRNLKRGMLAAAAAAILAGVALLGRSHNSEARMSLEYDSHYLTDLQNIRSDIEAANNDEAPQIIHVNKIAVRIEQRSLTTFAAETNPIRELIVQRGVMDPEAIKAIEATIDPKEADPIKLQQNVSRAILDYNTQQQNTNFTL